MSDWRTVVTKGPERVIETILAVATTLVLSIATVWLTGDSRATGLVVMTAGVAVSGVIGYNELRATRRDEAERPAADQTAAATTRVAKAAR
jgi:hypothetical protein